VLRRNDEVMGTIALCWDDPVWEAQSPDSGYVRTDSLWGVMQPATISEPRCWRGLTNRSRGQVGLGCVWTVQSRIKGSGLTMSV
jgi:hypothetical protein